jgi:uncharacterized protein YbjT (DUF2867 family)
MTKSLGDGARGFIGSALCQRLIASGVEVHAVSRKAPVDAGHSRRFKLGRAAAACGRSQPTLDQL